MSETVVDERVADADPEDAPEATAPKSHEGPDADGSDGSDGAAWRTGRASMAAVADGALAAVWVLVILAVVALTGWFSADAGLRWEPRSALRVAADAWALGQGANLVQPWGVVTVVPLGVTLLSIVAARRAGRRVASRAHDDVTDIDVVTAGALMLGGYLVVTLVVVVLAGAEESGPSLVRALVGSTLVVAVGALPVLLSDTGRGPAYAARLAPLVPGWLPGALRRATAALALQVGVAALLLGALLLRHADAGADAVAALQPSPLDAVVLGVACLLVLPNLVLWTAAWMVGPGVVVGSGTLVTPGALVVGPVPAVPFIGALPQSQPPAWMAAVELSPMVVGLVAVLLLRRSRPLHWVAALAQAVVAGVVAGFALGLLGAFASGSAGPGRLAEVGVPALELALTAAAATALGAVVGAMLLAVLDGRRARVTEHGDAGEEDTIEIVVENAGERAFTADGWRRVVAPADAGARADGR